MQHFVPIPGHLRANNVFDAGVGGVPFRFRISVALLVALEIAG